MKLWFALLFALVGCTNNPPAVGPVAGAALVAAGPDGQVTLFAAPGGCTAPARAAEWLSFKTSARVPGCWKLADSSVVQVVFLDGDALQLPASIFKPPSML